MRFRVHLVHSEEGYAVGAAAPPGCWSQGETRADALANIADAIRDYLSVERTSEESAEVDEVEA